MQNAKNPFMVSEEEIQTSSNVKFGLNTECNVTKFIFNDDITFNNNPQSYVGIEIVVEIEGKTFFNTIFLDFSKVYKHKVGWLEERHEGFKELRNKKVSQTFFIVKDYLLALGQREVNIDKLNATFDNNNITNESIIAHFKKLSELAPANYSDKKVDIFLEYQNQIKTGQERTFLQIPQYKDNGKFVCESSVGAEWTEARTNGSLIYIDESRGVTHPFERNEWFMNSKYANLQTDNSALNSKDTNSTTTKEEEIAF